MKYRPYTLMSPPFSPLSGGIRVMYGLYGWLLAKGQLAFLNSIIEDTPSIGIYPEIYHGNELKAEKVVRYILNRPGFMSSYGVPGPTEFDPKDTVYVFSEIYNTLGVDTDHIMFLPILNLHIFKDYKQKRRHSCFFVGKGQDKGIQPADSIKLDSRIASDQRQLAEFLNTCHTMYTYENPTAMVEIARLCGTKVIFLPEGAATPFTKEELTKKYEPGMMGVAFGIGDSAPFKSDDFRTHYISLVKKFEERLDEFIYETQSH